MLPPSTTGPPGVPGTIMLSNLLLAFLLLLPGYNLEKTQLACCPCFSNVTIENTMVIIYNAFMSSDVAVKAHTRSIICLFDIFMVSKYPGIIQEGFKATQSG